MELHPHPVLRYNNGQRVINLSEARIVMRIVLSFNSTGLKRLRRRRTRKRYRKTDVTMGD